jgi:hypothetical protein
MIPKAQQEACNLGELKQRVCHIVALPFTLKKYEL